MDALTVPRVALLGFVLGATTAVGWMVSFTLRSIASITRQHHWHQFKEL